VAVKVTGDPEQHGLTEALIDTETGSAGFTVIRIAFETTGFDPAQIRFEVS
jgi:hypothetical protein